ncbi:hypothetical protein CC78DRAFT_534501, partial [Lojkania enalia]
MPSNQQIIEEHKSNLPLPDQPPASSDWNSADERTVNVGSGSRQDDFSASDVASESGLRGPATVDSSVRTDGETWKTETTAGAGREAKDHLSGIPNDAVTREAKHKAGLAETTGKDYGYPQKNDPSSGL